jgi:hypothetical protein
MYDNYFLYLSEYLERHHYIASLSDIRVMHKVEVFSRPAAN